MTQTHARTPSTSVWDARADEFELRLRAVLLWARQNGAEADGRAIDLRAVVELSGLAAIGHDRRLPLLGGDGKSAFDLTHAPDELVTPIRSYVEEFTDVAAVPEDRKLSTNALTQHLYILMHTGMDLAERLA